LEENAISVKMDTTALHKVVVHPATALWPELNPHSWTSATKIMAAVTVSLTWKVTTAISVNRVFITCQRATLRDVHSVYVTTKEPRGDQDSANSSLETALVSHW